MTTPDAWMLAAWAAFIASAALAVAAVVVARSLRTEWSAEREGLRALRGTVARHGGRRPAGADAARALGIDWTERQTGLSQAIPPAYTEWIGTQLFAAMEAAA